MNGVIASSRRTQVPVNGIDITVGAFNPTLACTGTTNVTKYITGPDITVTDGDIFYNEATADTLYNGNNLTYSDGSKSFRISTTGVVSFTASC